MPEVSAAVSVAADSTVNVSGPVAPGRYQTVGEAAPSSWIAASLSTIVTGGCGGAVASTASATIPPAPAWPLPDVKDAARVPVEQGPGVQLNCVLSSMIAAPDPPDA